MSILTTFSMIPDRWPLDSRNAAEIEDEMHLSTPISSIGGENPRGQAILPYPLSSQESSQLPRSLSLGVQTQQSRPNVPYLSLSPSIHNELFFEYQPPGQASTSTHNHEGSSTSYLVFEPVVEDVANVESTDWRRYDPPRELLHSQNGESVDLQTILAPSIERIQARHLQEEERRAAAARVERPLARAGRASVKPRREISMGRSLDTNHLTPPSRLSSSNDTLSSSDSGYGSVSPGTEPSRSPRSASRRKFGLSSLFRRKDKTIIGLENLGEQNHPHESMNRENWPLPMNEALTSPAPVSESLTGECVSCLDDFAAEEMIKLTCHSYCSGCFQRLIRTALESETYWPAKCCLNTIPSTTILPHLSSETKKKFKQREAEWSIPAGDRIYCAQPSCSTWISPSHVNTQTHSAKCPKCSHRACTTCRGPFHNGDDCPQDPNLQATINLAELEGWKRCYSCHALVEHNKGCRHMTCRCKAQFCYICGLRWRTCACTDAQLATIQQRAEARRADETVRTARMAAEAEEERIAVEQVAAFIRREEERMAREAEAQRRREEERRRQAEEERRRREEERIAAISLRFRNLSDDLESLHDIQSVLLAERYEFETQGLVKDRQDALDTLAVRHPSELQSLSLESQNKIADAESSFEQEYQARLAEERRVEDQYVSELRVYWKDKPEGQYRIRDARDELRSDQDKEYRFWDAYRRKQLQAVVETETRRMEALRVKQAAEVKAVEGRARIDELEWRKKCFAEGRWMDAVVGERRGMLVEMEQAEYAHV